MIVHQTCTLKNGKTVQKRSLYEPPGRQAAAIPTSGIDASQFQERLSREECLVLDADFADDEAREEAFLIVKRPNWKPPRMSWILRVNRAEWLKRREIIGPESFRPVAEIEAPKRPGKISEWPTMDVLGITDEQRLEEYCDAKFLADATREFTRENAPHAEEYIAGVWLEGGKYVDSYGRASQWPGYGMKVRLTRDVWEKLVRDPAAELAASKATKPKALAAARK